MVTMHCWHPDIEEFITAKQTSGRLTKFNMSVLLTDEFMKCVHADRYWDLVFPGLTDKEFYKKNWNGDINKWRNLGGKIKIYKTIKAVDLYNLIMKSTYDRAEPGVIFIDTVNHMNNLTSIETISASNPCGEQYLPIGGACLLGNINATQFIDPVNNCWDFSKVSKYLPYMIRMMDNVIDLTHMPLPEQYDEIKNKRRIGFGTMGLGSALMIMRVKYGSEESLELIDSWFNFITNEVYKISANLSEEKGAFPLWNYNNFLIGDFHEVLDSSTLEVIKKKGLRNSHITSCQPTGNTGILANNISGGIEPVFMTEYIRTHGVDVLPENVPTYDKWTESIKEGDVEHKTIIIDKIRYKWNKNSGYTKESLVEDYAVQYLKSVNEWDSNASWASTTTSLTVEEHLNVMKVISKYLDSAMSKTVNLPNDYNYEDFKNLYMNAWLTGTIKGLTTYRANTMSAVLKSKDDVVIEERPKSLPCDIHHTKADGENWIVLVGLMNNQPYELFTFKPIEIDLHPSLTKGFLIKEKIENGNRYDLETEHITIKGLSRHFFSDEEQALTRMISTLGLRTNVDLEYIIEQLNKTPTTITRFSKVIARTLSKYISAKTLEERCPECGEKLVRLEGCIKCSKSCGYSKCG